MATEWYCMREGNQVGPLSPEQMKAAYERGELADSTPVWTVGLPSWTQANLVRERIMSEAAPDVLAGLGLPPLAVDLRSQPGPPLKPSIVSNPMELGDRLIRALFVALAVGLAWGIRGSFGHVLGAMYPGAILGLAFVYVTGQESLVRRMPVVAALSAIGIGLGGDMSYGLLHGYAQADTFANYSYGFLTLFLLGGAWGCFGCAMVGLLLEERRSTTVDWIGTVACVALFGAAVWWLVFKGIGFDINPYRSNSALGFVGGTVGLFVWLALRRRRRAMRGAVLGFVGFGLGMAGGRLVANVFQNMEELLEINHWNTMEVTAGLVGGFVFAFGMLGRSYPDRSGQSSISPLEIAGSLFVLGLIPLLHRISRIDSADVQRWTNDLKTFGSSWTASGISGAMSAVVVLALLAAVVWIYLQAAEKERLTWFPVMALTLIMLVYQNFYALYFFGPGKDGYFDMHNVYWVIFLAMAGYVGYREFSGGHTDDAESEEAPDGALWPWILAGLAGFALIVAAAGVVNGEHTMKNAETRWPIWSHRDGPFPGASRSGG